MCWKRCHDCLQSKLTVLHNKRFSSLVFVLFFCYPLDYFELYGIMFVPMYRLKYKIYSKNLAYFVILEKKILKIMSKIEIKGTNLDCQVSLEDTDMLKIIGVTIECFTANLSTIQSTLLFLTILSSEHPPFLVTQFVCEQKAFSYHAIFKARLKKKYWIW